MEKSTKLFLWAATFWVASGISAVLDGKYPIFNGFMSVSAWLFMFAAFAIGIMFACALAEEY